MLHVLPDSSHGKFRRNLPIKVYNLPGIKKVSAIRNGFPFVSKSLGTQNLNVLIRSNIFWNKKEYPVNKQSVSPSLDLEQ